jgi:DNA primase
MYPYACGKAGTTGYLEQMDAKEDIRARLAIEDVIGEYVQLKRAGRSWKGLSPFTPEKTPSFVVSPDKQIWHDFSSGRGGDMFAFVMEMEGLDFRQTLELLARRAGVDLDQYKQFGAQKGPQAKQKTRLYELLDLAATFYQTQLVKNNDALTYLRTTRAFSKQTIVGWRLGYSPNNGRALVDFLLAKGYGESELKLAGVTSQHYRGGLQDMFRGRIQIPLCDATGRVVGFTARLLADDAKAPKYINTPSTPLYDKSRHVFGLHFAKDAIRASKFVLLAEGNLDVISSHQAGIAQVVATAGTALTEPHLKTLSRLTGDIRLCFDADKAGIAATERAIPIAQRVGVALQVVTIPSGKDPDELIRQDVELWKKTIASPQYVVDWLIDRYKQALDLETVAGKRQFSDVVLGVVRQLSDAVEQEHYISQLAAMLHVSDDALRTKLHQQPSAPAAVRRVVHKPAGYGELFPEKQRTEEHLLALALLVPKLRTNLYGLTDAMFDDLRSREIFLLLQKQPDFNNSHAAEMQSLAEYGKILGLVYETLYQDLEPLEQQNEATRLRTKLVDIYVRNQKHALVAELQDAEPKKAEELLARARELDVLLRNNQS